MKPVITTREVRIEAERMISEGIFGIDLMHRNALKRKGWCTFKIKELHRLLTKAQRERGVK